MKFGTLRTLSAAAVAAALALPAAAQNRPSFEDASGRNAARGAQGEAGTVIQPGAAVQPGGTVIQGQPAGTVIQSQPGVVGQPGAVRPGATIQPGTVPPGTVQPGTIIEGQPALGPDGRPIVREAGFGPREGTIQGEAAGRAGAQGQGRIDDRALVRFISVGNEAEIRVSELGQQRAQNEEVKQFAQRMIEEHTAFGQKLRQAAGQGRQGEDGRRPAAEGREGRERPEGEARERRPAREGEARPAREGEGRPARDAERNDSSANDADRNEVSFQPGAGREVRIGGEVREGGAVRGEVREGGAVREGGVVREGTVRDSRGAVEGQPGARREGGMARQGGNPLLGLHEQVKQQSTEALLADLRSKQGAEFDKAFMGWQVGAHQEMLATLKVAERHASPNLQEVLREGQKSTQEHLEHAKRLKEQVEQQNNR